MSTTAQNAEPQLAPITDPAALFTGRQLAEEDVPVGDLGTVRVRALSRSEVLAIREAGAVSVSVMERKLMAAAMVAPALTEDQVREWQDASAAGELEPVTTALMRLSGISQTAAKEMVRRFPR